MAGKTVINCKNVFISNEPDKDLMLKLWTELIETQESILRDDFANEQ